MKDAPPAARRALIAASLGWMLDAFDVMLYALVLAHMMKDLGMSKGTAGLMSSLTLLAAAGGGVVFGVLADRRGRTWALRASVLIYSVFTAACGLARSVPMLAVFRIFLGLGMGGEWTSGAALVTETWPDEHRGKAMGFVQSFWAVGYAAAALVTAIVYPLAGWRAVFFVGVLPALLIFWVQRKVEEPALWRAHKAQAVGKARTPIGAVIRGRLLGITVAVTLMNGFLLFGWWGFNTWIPGYFSLAQNQGGIGLSPWLTSSIIFFMQFGMWIGYLTFGYFSDIIGRKKTYIIYFTAAAVFIFIYAHLSHPLLLFILGPFVAFFGTGGFSGFGALTAELYPTRFRATLQGTTYNLGRIGSAVAPLAIGSLAQQKGFGTAFLLASGAFVAAAVMWIWIPETRGKALE
ncbi:MAG: MFS transporter [Candidatus Aminicenantes bacterium]|nr:MFS transporter [Candidatus Aminicenantes bacterium]